MQISSTYQVTVDDGSGTKLHATFTREGRHDRGRLTFVGHVVPGDGEVHDETLDGLVAMLRSFLRESLGRG